MAELNSLIVNGVTRLNNDVFADKYVTNNGTSSQFVKGDGTLDSSVYVSSANVSTALSEKASIVIREWTTTYESQ